MLITPEHMWPSLQELLELLLFLLHDATYIIWNDMDRISAGGCSTGLITWKSILLGTYDHHPQTGNSVFHIMSLIDFAGIEIGM